MGRKLFDDDENDSDTQINFEKQSDYSKKYETLRRKEEILKLKNKYGATIENSDDSSSSEDIDDVTFTEQFEKDFFKTLSCLKNKDPRIYDSNTRFFSNSNEIVKTETKSKKEKALTIQDYNRKLILDNNGEEDEEDVSTERPPSPTYVEEQDAIKKSFINVVNDDEDDGIGGMFVKRIKTKEEQAEEEKGFRDWLRGQEIILEREEENDLKPLKDFWANPKLNEDEAFLRDYVLNQRFKDTDSDRIPTYDEIVNEQEMSEDEKLNEATEFEHKFNFRFEEPDQEFIKRYPRTLEHTLRLKDDKRSKKRLEVKERKAEEKKRKREEIAQLKSLKLKEIQEKISQIKEITGNDQLAFDPEDLEGDFDPEAYDKKMQEMFNEEYYDNNPDEKKPKFPELDDELEIDNWDTWDADHVTANDHEPHCEDEDFNMDCDYDPTTKNKKSLIENLKETIEGPKKKRRRKNKLAEVLSTEKPVFDPKKLKKSFSQYIDDYYKLDCEDIIGDMPCRFKYRQVPACDYGLSVEEILLADDKELNRWYPIKKTLQYRPDHWQHNEQRMYSNKAKDLDMKRKILPSLFEENQNDEDEEAENNTQENKRKKNKKKKKNKSKQNIGSVNETTSFQNSIDDNVNNTDNKTQPETKKKRKKSNDSTNMSSKNIINNIDDETQPKTKKKKMNKDKNNEDSTKMSAGNIVNNIDEETQPETTKKKKSKDKNNENSKNMSSENIVKNIETDVQSGEKITKMKNKNKHTENDKISNDASQETQSGGKKSKKKNKNTKMLHENIPKMKKKHSEENNIEKKSLHKVDPKSKNKFKHKNKINSNKMDDKKNSLANLTDERLKAYGLNPKKYRSFMKFKKF